MTFPRTNHHLPSSFQTQLKILNNISFQQSKLEFELFQTKESLLVLDHFFFFLFQEFANEGNCDSSSPLPRNAHPGVNFTNILHVAFSYKSFARRFFVPKF